VAPVVMQLLLTVTAPLVVREGWEAKMAQLAEVAEQAAAQPHKPQIHLEVRQLPAAAAETGVGRERVVPAELQLAR
jgi:hypothetical protein